MAIGTPVGFGDTSQATTGTTASITLPTISVDGVVVLEVSANSGSGTFGTPTGYTAEPAGINISGSTLEGQVFYKAVTAADSGATVSSGLGTTRRWTMAGVYIPGATTTNINIVQSFSAASIVNIIIPAITPTDNDSLWVALAAQRNNTTTPSAVGAVASGWTEVTDTSTSVATAPQFLGWAAHKQLSGQGGVAQTAVNNSAINTTATGTQVSWSITVSPAVTTITGTGASTEGDDTTAGTGSEVITGTAALTTDDDVIAGVGLEVITGTSSTTETDDSAAGSGLEVLTGTGAVVEGDDSASGSGTVTLPPTTGTGSVTEGDDTASGIATVGTVNWFKTPTVERAWLDNRKPYNRYTLPRGVSVVKVNGHYVRSPIPEYTVLLRLVEGVDYFLGGRAAVRVSDAVAAQLAADGFATTTTDPDA